MPSSIRSHNWKSSGTLKAECERRAAETGMLRAEIALAGATITKESA